MNKATELIFARRWRFCICRLALALSLASAYHSHADSAGVCAKVGLRLDQSAVMTRTAFRATLEISNHDPGSPLTSVSAQVQIKDGSGQLANSRFQIGAPTLDSIDHIDGSGTIAASGIATIRWLLIPTDEAAPTTATEFFVGGQFSYILGGTPATVPLEQVKITVYPDAALDLTYFHQRDVFSDDPFTPEVEPSQPYALVVMVKSRGAGAANSLKITAAEPQIVDNQKGLLIDFKLVGTSLDGAYLANTLAMDFGRVEPGSIRIAEWWFTSSLQGFFRDFKATFQHEDNLGNVHLSTIKSVSIHEMEHIVYAGYPFDDGKVDCLVNDSPDPASLPDALYLSDGTTNPVQVVQQSSVSGVPSGTNLSVQLSAAMPAGWSYLRVPEPSDGQLHLSRVRRSDGVDISVGTNVWTTDRTFVGPGQRPVRENILHLLDYNSPGSYTLTYGDITTNAPTDTVPPSSAVAVLPPQSPVYFPVTWSGQDDTNGSGVAFFDIFVSTNGGPFQVWLSHTTLRGAIFTGVQSNTYAFYSVATDVAGNRQPPAGAANAQTTVSIVNHAPAFGSIPEQIVNEGNTFSLKLPVSDPDLPKDTLSFSLAAGSPPGMTIDSVNGILQWATGEADGPSTNLVTLNVHDSGNPPLADSKVFRLIVNEVNSRPVLAAIANRTISEGQLLRITNSATDSDLPRQTLAFTIGAGAPPGVSIDSATGFLSWQPTEFQGGTTNRLSVIVTDDGPGSLSATQSFTVTVRDTRSDFVLSVGSTNALPGESNSVPLVFSSGAELAAMSFVVEAAESNITSLTLTALAPQIVSIAPDRYAADHVRFSVVAQAGNPFQGTFRLALLSFNTVSNERSVIIPVRISAVTGTRTSSSVLANGQGLSGRIFVTAHEPILDAAISSNAIRTLVLYGLTNHSYAVELTTNLVPLTGWILLQNVTLDSSFHILSSLPAIGSTIFYRARELIVTGAPLNIRRAGGSLVVDWPSDCQGCILEESAALGQNAAWSQSSTQPQLVGGRYQVTIPGAPANRFYRLRRP